MFTKSVPLCRFAGWAWAVMVGSIRCFQTLTISASARRRSRPMDFMTRGMSAPADFAVSVPTYMKEIIAEITRLARRSPDVNQRSGVSVSSWVTGLPSMGMRKFTGIDGTSSSRSVRPTAHS